jgi:paraquat-inducible protein B
MARKAKPALIGAFVLGAIVLALVGLIIFGGGRFFTQKQVAVAYFDESIKGLSIGAPVTFNGVKIGAVTDIKVVVDPDERQIIWTPVFFEVEASRFQDRAGHRIKFSQGTQNVKELIDRGMRAQLEMQSFVTGQLAVSLDLHPGTPIRLTGRSRELPEIPTVHSSAEKLARTLENLPIEEIVLSLKKALAGVDQLVNAPEVKDAIRSLNAAAGQLAQLAQTLNAEVKPLVADVSRTLDTTRDALKDAQKLVRNVDGQVSPMAESVQKTLAAARVTLEQAHDAIGGVNGLVADGSPLQQELQTTLRELSAAARSIRVLSDYLERHPDSLVFGKATGGH